MRLSILFGGKAGQGANILSTILGDALIKNGYYVFVSRDYQSLIRGGHNFNVLTFSETPVNSNDSAMDIIIALDKETAVLHKNELKKSGIVISGEGKGNMYFAGRMFKTLCLDFKILEESIKKLEKKQDENMKEAREGYAEEKKITCRVNEKKKNFEFMNGNAGIADGAVKAGIDIYYAYPMTPATNVLSELAEKQIKNNIFVAELESEVAVINAGIGSAITGAKVMIGTSGGGFDLMTEALSLAGIAKVPLVIYLASRPGPSTGVATYTQQGDLDMARYAGHGEFPRMVLAPGCPLEAQELTSQAFYFSQKFGIPVIVLSDKHLAECFFTSDKKPEITPSKKMTEVGRYNSYETDKFGCATENANIIVANVEERLKRIKEIAKEAEKFKQFNISGKANSKNIILFWGSTQGAILDACENLDAKLLQIMHMEPFSDKIKKEIEGKNIILVENNSTSQLGKLIAEKTGIIIPDSNKILRYDGRPFLGDELNEEIKKKLK